jgi:hypothetical protein
MITQKPEDRRPNPGRYLGLDRGQFTSILISRLTNAGPTPADLLSFWTQSVC